MITNTPSFETNFQALPEDIQNKIKGYVPNVRIDRASESKFFNEVIQPKIHALPLEIQNHIKGYNPIVIVDHTSRNKLYNQLKTETKQKVGLYGENLILKGLDLCDELFEEEKDYKLHKTELENLLVLNSSPKKSWFSPVPTLFSNALNNPTGKSLTALNVLYYANRGAEEALQQLKVIPKIKEQITEIDSKFEQTSKKINNCLERIREQRTTEQTIYNACGGKDKFHDLKILSWENANVRQNYAKIDKGETVMRGLDDNGCPFIAISINGQKDYYDFEKNIITVIEQLDCEDPTKWASKGNFGGLLCNTKNGSVSPLGIKTGDRGPFSIKEKDNMEYDTGFYIERGSSKTRIDNLFPTLKELLTTGSSFHVAKHAESGWFKLKEQV